MDKAKMLSAIDKDATSTIDDDLYDFKSNNNSRTTQIKDAKRTDFQSGFTILLDQLPAYKKDADNSYYINLYNEMHKDTIDKNEGKSINGGNKTQRNKNNKKKKNKMTQSRVKQRTIKNKV